MEGGDNVAAALEQSRDDAAGGGRGRAATDDSANVAAALEQSRDAAAVLAADHQRVEATACKLGGVLGGAKADGNCLRQKVLQKRHMLLDEPAFKGFTKPGKVDTEGTDLPTGIEDSTKCS